MLIMNLRLGLCPHQVKLGGKNVCKMTLTFSFFFFVLSLFFVANILKITPRNIRQEKYTVILDCEKSTDPLSHSILAYR